MNLARYRRSRPIIEVLGGAEQGMVVAACTSGQVSERNASITLLALVTGLRACDIIGLRLADVDWRGATISIVQQKTGNPLTLPLPPLVLGKLADYVLRERPATADEHVFVRVPAPHTRLADHASVHTVITRTFRAAGMADVSAGTRFLRHSTATGLLRAGVPLPTISAVLGHAREDSSGDYMSKPSGIASGGRETAGHQVAVVAELRSATSSGGFLTRHVSRVIPSDAGSARLTVGAADGLSSSAARKRRGWVAGLRRTGGAFGELE